MPVYPGAIQGWARPAPARRFEGTDAFDVELIDYH
jgi:hypothetical protein